MARYRRAWAWDRHHNSLSWYIRPLFLIPFYFAYQRSLRAIMAWFPAPDGRRARSVPNAEKE